MQQLTLPLKNEQQTVDLGGLLANAVQQLDVNSLVVFLHGDLGAGKTTLTRGFVQGLGHKGNVKSPTYTLVEPYELPPWYVYHFDLYRLSDPEELEYMGIRDYFLQKSCCFVEWSEKGSGILPPEDLMINLTYNEQMRDVTIIAKTERGNSIIKTLSLLLPS